jgi:hypothetical protein
LSRPRRADRAALWQPVGRAGQLKAQHMKTIVYRIVCRDEDVDEVTAALDFGLETCQCECLATFDQSAAAPNEFCQFVDHYPSDSS